MNGIKEKKLKGCSEENSSETSSKEKSKPTEAQKQDYIHVRARRGQATDSHSLAERVRYSFRSCHFDTTYISRMQLYGLTKYTPN